MIDLLCVFVGEDHSKVSHELAPSLLPELEPLDGLQGALLCHPECQVIGHLLPQLFVCGEAMQPSDPQPSCAEVYRGRGTLPPGWIWSRRKTIIYFLW